MLEHSERQRIARLKKYLEFDEHEFTKNYFRTQYAGQGDILLRRQFASCAPSRRSVERFYDPLESATERLQRFDLYTFNQTHTQVYDRLGAPFGIHVTTPFLAPEIVDIAQTLPSKLKSDGGIAKPVLKALASRFFFPGVDISKESRVPNPNIALAPRPAQFLEACIV